MRPAPKPVRPGHEPADAGLDALLKPRDVARVLAIGLRTFERLVSSGNFPGPDLRIGRSVRWRASTARSWIDANSRGARNFAA